MMGKKKSRAQLWKKNEKEVVKSPALEESYAFKSFCFLYSSGFDRELLLLGKSAIERQKDSHTYLQPTHRRSLQVPGTKLT